jgi:hypothetical protein
MITTPTTIEQLLDYWPGNIPFKGSLVSEDGSCMCAQGQALHFLDGLTVDELRNIEQFAADRRVAKLFDISLTHSCLLRIVNDRQEGAPSSVIRSPEKVLGDQAQVILAFWRHLDRMAPAARRAAGEAAWAAAWEAAWAAAGEAAGAAAREAAGEAAWAAAWEAAWAAAWAAAREAAGASNEIQGAAVMRAINQPFFFLPLFGFANPEAVTAVSN